MKSDTSKMISVKISVKDCAFPLLHMGKNSLEVLYLYKYKSTETDLNQNENRTGELKARG